MTVFSCPISTCDWTHESEDSKYGAGNAMAAPAIGEAMGIPGAALLDIHRHQGMKRDEAALERHFKSHPVLDWVTDLMAARREIQALEMNRDSAARS